MEQFTLPVQEAKVEEEMVRTVLMQVQQEQLTQVVVVVQMDMIGML